MTRVYAMRRSRSTEVPDLDEDDVCGGGFAALDVLWPVEEEDDDDDAPPPSLDGAALVTAGTRPMAARGCSTYPMRTKYHTGGLEPPPAALADVSPPAPPAADLDGGRGKLRYLRAHMSKPSPHGTTPRFLPHTQ